MQLSLSRGGLGLRSIQRHHSAAYLASYSKALPEERNEPVYLRAVEEYENLIDDELQDNGKPLVQKELSDRLDKRSYDLLVEKANEADKVRLESAAAPFSSAWLCAVPAKYPVNMSLEPNQFSAVLRHRLGLPLSDKNAACSSCAKQRDRPVLLDPLGHHALTCNRKGFIQARHNNLAWAFNAICKRAQLHPKMEQGAEERDQSRPADVLLPNFLGGRDVALDFTVISPLTPENLNGAVVAENRAVAAVTKAEYLKHVKYDDKCNKNNWEFKAMAVSTYGVWGGEARELFNSVIMHIMNQVGLSKSVATSFVYNWLGIVIARENAQAILAKLPIQKVGRSDIVNLVGRDAESPFLVPENIFPVVVRPPVDVVPPVCVVSPAVSPSVPSLRAVPPPPSPVTETMTALDIRRLSLEDESDSDRRVVSDSDEENAGMERCIQCKGTVCPIFGSCQFPDIAPRNDLHSSFDPASVPTGKGH